MEFSKFSLRGKVALITGGSGLLGQEHAAALLEAGAKVLLTDISIEKLEIAKARLSSLYPDRFICTHVMDVTSKDTIYKVMQELGESDVSIDILINNAAIDPKVEKTNGLDESSRLENFRLEDWNLQLNVGLTGAFLCSQIIGSSMASDKKGGVIVNIASDLSVISPDQRLYRKQGLDPDLQPVKPVTYSVIKSGLVGLTKYLATYWSDRGIRCNSLSPGGVYTGQSDEFVEKLENLIPCGRMAKRDEYRSAIQFLCSDASAYMNGQNIVMDGGRSVW